jgi:hypothetical protein
MLYDISLTRFVIPGLTKPSPYLIRGNPVGFCPALGRTAFAGIATLPMINVTGFSSSPLFPSLGRGKE